MTSETTRPGARTTAGRLTARLATLGALLATALLAGPAAADPPAPPREGPYLGVLLDWSEDRPDDYRDRLGVAPAVYAIDASLPLADQEAEDLGRALAEAAAQDAGLLVTLLPDVPLDELDDEAVAELVEDLEAAGVGGRTPVWLRPMPEMNAPWTGWGQQPRAFVERFRALADAVHADLERTAMVWQPAYGAGYPFAPVEDEDDSSLDAGPAREPGIDTSGDGRLTSRDDPYGPYWPGPEAVDWVGMNHYHWDDTYPFGQNQRPVADELVDQLAGTYGYPDPGARLRERDFYARFVERAGVPMLLETGALYSVDDAARRGDTEAEIKRAWWDQLAAPDGLRAHPGIGMVVWNEFVRPEAEIDDAVVDWRATHTPRLAAGFRERLVEAAGLTTGTAGAGTGAGTGGSAGSGRDASDVAANPGVDDPADERGGTVLDRAASLLVAGGAGALGVLLLVLAWTPWARRWSYATDSADPRRDLRIDLMRGFAICLVVVDHIGIPSLVHLVSQEAIGPLSSAELFVALSGVVVGVVYGPRTTSTPEWSVAAGAVGRRAGKLWATALVTILLVYLVAIIPGLDARVLTTFTDEGTGDAGASGRGRVYDLYAGIDSLLDYPVPNETLRDILLLRMGPSQINIIGLYVVLLLITPLLTWLLLKRLWPVLLLLSLGTYTVYQLDPVRVLPSQFENPFPLLAWQVLFVLGLVAGWHRQRLLSAAATLPGRVAVSLVALTTLAFAVFSWSGPYLSNRFDVRLSLLADDDFRRVYDAWFSRTDLAPGRLLAVACFVVTAYALLTCFWGPLRRASGWFLLPLGQSTLYVFVVHVVFVVAVANLTFLTDDVWWGTLTHVAVLALLWLMVRTRFLFGIVPR